MQSDGLSIAVFENAETVRQGVTVFLTPFVRNSTKHFVGHYNSPGRNDAMTISMDLSADHVMYVPFPGESHCLTKISGTTTSWNDYYKLLTALPGPTFHST